MSGLLCLKWNNHSTAFYKTLNNHRTKELYCDTTIACRGKYYPVHRLVLSTCSEYFEEIFERTQCKHPFIIIKDIQPAELEALLNYMYKGEVNVLQEMLPGLIKAAEALKIKGLAVPDDEDDADEESSSAKDRKRSHSSSSPAPYAKRSKKIEKKQNRQFDNRIKPSQTIEVEPEIIPLEEDLDIDSEVPHVSPVPPPPLPPPPTSESVPTTKSSSTKNDLVFVTDGMSSTFSQDLPITRRSSVDKNREDVLEEYDNSGNLEMNDVKVEPLEIPESTEENSYSVSDPELESKSDAEGSLFQTLLGSDGPSLGDKKPQSSASSDSHPMAQCSTWDDNLDPSNEDSQLNSEGMQDEIPQLRRRHRTRRIYQEEDRHSSDIVIEEIHTEKEASASADDQEDEATLEHCTFCSYASKYKTNLRTHILRKHTTELAYACTECEYRCSTKESLKVHTRKHTGEKPYECKMCSYKAGYYASIKKHMMVHTGEKPFKCPKCPYSAIQKNPLIRHMKNHENEPGWDSDYDFALQSPVWYSPSP